MKISAKKRTKNKAVSRKIKKILKEGIRKNTHKPVSKGNKRRPVSQKQRILRLLPLRSQ